MKGKAIGVEVKKLEGQKVKIGIMIDADRKWVRGGDRKSACKVSNESTTVHTVLG